MIVRGRIGRFARGLVDEVFCGAFRFVQSSFDAIFHVANGGKQTAFPVQTNDLMGNFNDLRRLSGLKRKQKGDPRIGGVFPRLADKLVEIPASLARPDQPVEVDETFDGSRGAAGRCQIT